MIQFPAHIRTTDAGEPQIQTVTEHCRNVSAYCSNALRQPGLSSTGRLAGLVHDSGKFTAAFSDYITRAARGEAVRRGSVNHTFAGVRLLLERYADPAASSYRNLASEMLAFAAGSHHGQFDSVDPEGQDGFAHRTQAQNIFYEEAKANFLSECAEQTELDALFDASVSEIEHAVSQCKTVCQTQDELFFCFFLLSRLLLSALIDADRQDTAEFMCDMPFPSPPEDMRPIWDARLKAVERRLSQFPADRPVDQARRAISEQCRAFSARECGIYRLSVPTGGGKTLASLRAALAHAAAHGKQRIFFLTPLLSVLEQNAHVIRTYLEDDSLVLEHHSNVVREENTVDELDYNELLTENWHAPVVITTLVQFLNTLFDGGNACIRRMHALCNSVIVLDEIQSVPRHMLSPFNLAVNFLSGVCGATVILCSATQPCLETAVHPLLKPHDLIPYDPALWTPFHRTEIVDQCQTGSYTPETLADFALEQLADAGSLLLICNTKAQAATMYEQLRHADAQVFHLSTAMCMAHRILSLKQINACLEQRTPVVCVSTQLVEAGVDFSFGCVIRLFAGMDNVVQAAGRCNRSGEFGALRPVFIVKLQGETLTHLREIQQAQNASEELLGSFRQNSAAYQNDLQSDSAITYYYRRLFFNMPRLAQDYPVPQHKTTLFQMLSLNSDFRLKSNAPHPAHLLGQAFRTAGEAFKVFDNSTTDVLVPFDEGTELITALNSAKAQHDLLYRKSLLDQAKHYSVSLFEYQLKQLQACGGLLPLCGNTVCAVQPPFYSLETGVTIKGSESLFLEV